MKPMTEKQIMNSTLKELGFYLDPSLGNCLTIPSENGYIRIETKAVGIELIPEKPEINIKNLGLFMAKFGEYPEAQFWNDRCATKFDGELASNLHGQYQRAGLNEFEHCEIIDDRWTKENLEG
jgi:hypothetical protein